MQQLIKGMIIGSAITAAAMAGYAFGTNTDHSEWPNRVVSGTSINDECDVQVGFGRYTPGNECRFDQVMIGIRDTYLICADLRVTCPSK